MKETPVPRNKRDEAAFATMRIGLHPPAAAAAWEAPPWVASPMIWSAFLALLPIVVRLFHFSDAPGKPEEKGIMIGLLLAWISVALWGILRILRKKEPALYPRHGTPMFGIVVGLWMITIAATGNFESVAMYVFLAMMALLGQLSLILRLSAITTVILAVNLGAFVMNRYQSRNTLKSEPARSTVHGVAPAKRPPPFEGERHDGTAFVFVYLRSVLAECEFHFARTDFEMSTVSARKDKFETAGTDKVGRALNDNFVIMMFLPIAGAMLAYAFLMREFLPVAGTYFFHETTPIQGHDRMLERLTRSILLRALKIYDADAACAARAQRVSEGSPLVFKLTHSIGWKSTKRGESKPEMYGLPHWLDRHLREALKKPLVAHHPLWTIGNYENGDAGGNVAARSLLIVRTGPEIEPDEQMFVVLLSKRRFAFWLSSQGLLQVFWSEVLVLLQWATQIAFWRELTNTARNLKSYEQALAKICSQMAPRGIRPLRAVLSIRTESDRREPTERNADSGAGEVIFVSTSQLVESHTDVRWWLVLQILVDRTKLSDVDDDDVAKARSEIRRFAVDLFRSHFLKILFDLYLHGERGAKASRGMATLTYPPRVQDRIAKFDPTTMNERDHFRDFGFTLIRVNPLMRAWLPWLPTDAELASGTHLCWKSYLRPTELASNEYPEQGGACPGCPVIKQIKRHEQALKNEGEGQSRFDPLPAPAPCGERRIIRHFYLSCHLDIFPHSRAVTGLEEVVEDRTTRLEQDAFIHWLQSEAAGNAVREFTGRNRTTPVFQPVFQHLAEGVGRIFHADHVLFVWLGGNKVGKVEACFRRFTIDADHEARAAFNSREWSLLQEMRSVSANYSFYFLRREPLFHEDPNFERFSDIAINEDIVDEWKGAARACRSTGRAHEWVSTATAAPGFWVRSGDPGQIDALKLSERIVVSPIPTTDLAVVICTGAPERWERQDLDKSEQLIPRDEEMIAIYDMCTRLGNAMNGLGITSQVYYEIYKQIQVGLHHELTHLFYPMTERAGFIEEFVEHGVFLWAQARGNLRAIGAEDLFGQWCAAISKAAKDLLFLSNREVQAATRAMCLAASGDSGEERSRWEVLAKLGLDPDKLPGIKLLQNLPDEQRRAVVRCLWQFAHLAESVPEIRSAVRHANRVFRLTNSASDFKRPVNLVDVLRDVVRGFSHDTTQFGIAAEIPETLTVPLYENAFAMMMQVLITNAVKAVRTEQPHDTPAIRVAAAVLEGRLVMSVASRGASIRAPERLFFDSMESTTGGSGVGLAVAQRQAAINGGRLSYDYRGGDNIFTFTQQPTTE